MSTAATIEWINEVSPSFKARIAGGLYFLTMLSSAFLERLMPGKTNLIPGLIEIVGISAVTLVLYLVFRPVSRSLSLLAAAFNFVGITLETIKFASHGTDIGMVFHGVFCILIGILIFRSTWMPLILGASIALAGLAWFTFFAPAFAASLSPWNLACGLAGEASTFLWLLLFGVNDREWKQQAGSMEGSI